MRVLEIFSSLQGEGVWAGTPMTFVRFAGCNAPDLGLGCLGWCDTEGSHRSDGGEEMTASAVAEEVGRRRLPRACLTGGEPLLQGEEFAVLVRALQAGGVAVHVETNGTLGLPGGVRPQWVTVSPKPPDYLVSPDLHGAVDEIKLVVDGAFEVATAEALAAAHPDAALCLQPESGAFEERVKQATAAVMAHPRWRLSLQIHRILGLP